MTRNRSQVRIIAIAGPKGGIGRTTCAIALARALCMRDHHVLIVDTSPACGQCSALLDLPPIAPQPPLDFAVTHTSLDALDAVTITPEPDILDDFFAHLRECAQYDDIILDLCSNLNDESFGMFIRSDIPIVLSAPEQPIILAATQWLRIAIIRYIKRFESSPELSETLSRHASDWDFDTVYASLSPELRERFLSELGAFRCAFLLNHKRENSEDLQSRALCHAWGMLLGLNIQYIGSLNHEDRRWFYARHLAEVTIFSREDPLVRELDIIAREKLSGRLFKSHPCLPLLDAHLRPLDFLMTDDPDSYRQAYRLLWEGYRRDSGLVSNILSKEKIAEIIARLETAYKCAESSGNAVNETPLRSSEMKAVARSFSATFAAIGTTYSPECCQDDAGKWLAAMRERKGITRSQIALKTRIPVRIIEKLESQKFSEYPAARLQAYLFEIANALGLDFSDVSRRFGITEARKS
ncbi:MAG: helix-turn-helix domain-containing protein [Proteobacteria bacterium]|nr:helix-turn-helix domain-containing protein [Pseudomonadota bacterium]MBQ9243735.1 helix-turn-helix domain-containing protein [Pseudomonadota bacterium]